MLAKQLQTVREAPGRGRPPKHEAHRSNAVRQAGGPRTASWKFPASRMPYGIRAEWFVRRSVWLLSCHVQEGRRRALILEMGEREAEVPVRVKFCFNES